MHCIYFILCPASSKLYVGSTMNYSKRLRTHLWALKRGDHCNVKLQRSYNRHKRLLCGILERVERVHDLIAREQHWIDLLEAASLEGGLNISPTAGSTLGKSCKPETRQKIGAANRGRKNPNAGKPGKPHTLEARMKMSAARLGRKFTPEHCARKADAQRGSKNHRFGKPGTMAGRHHSIESRKLISEKAKGRIMSLESRAKISAATKGLKRSLEARARISAGKIKFYQEKRRLAELQF